LICVCCCVSIEVLQEVLSVNSNPTQANTTKQSSCLTCERSSDLEIAFDSGRWAEGQDRKFENTVHDEAKDKVKPQNYRRVEEVRPSAESTDRKAATCYKNGQRPHWLSESAERLIRSSFASGLALGTKGSRVNQLLFPLHVTITTPHHKVYDDSLLRRTKIFFRSNQRVAQAAPITCFFNPA
jgi:hypothetical protein